MKVVYTRIMSKQIAKWHEYWRELPPRLRVLSLYYLAAGAVFWYVIEKLFLTQTLHLSGFQIIWLILRKHREIFQTLKIFRDPIHNLITKLAKVLFWHIA